MIYTHVTYRIRNEHREKAEREISRFTEALHANQTRFQSYQIFRHATDAASLIHFMSFPDQEAQLEHVQSPQVKLFVENMLAFCEVGPLYTELSEVAALAAAQGR